MNIPTDDNPDRWARVQVLARALAVARVDLDDEAACWRVAFKHGVSPGEAMQITPEAISAARRNREDATWKP